MPKNQTQFKIQHSTFNIKTSLSPELLFLIACCQTDPSEEDIDLIITYLNAEHDILHPPSSIINLAASHGVLPLVYKTIKKLSTDHSSLLTPHSSLEHLLNELKVHYQSIAQRNILMSSELIRIMNLLRENSIEALAFKGPALAQMAYGDITLRQYVDLDILVDESDAFNAGRLMSENGHTAVLPLKILSNETCLHAAKDFSLMSKDGLHTELHWRLFEKKYAISIMSCTTQKKCQAVTINGHTLQTLQNELLMVYLCLHGAKHAFERIEWICDIDRLIRNTEVNWDDAMSIANQSHAKRSFFLGLSLAQTLFHTPLPQNIQSHINADTIVQLQTLILSRISKEKEARSVFKKNREVFFYQSKLFDTKSDKIRFYISVFLKISTTDCQTFLLPEKLNFLYIFLKPLRLLWSYGKRIVIRNK